MSYPMKMEVFHKILHEYEFTQKPIHENEAYANLSEEDKKLFAQFQTIWEKSSAYSVKQEFNAAEGFASFLHKVDAEENEPKIVQIPPKTPVFFLSRPLLRYAAVLLVLIVATFVFINRGETYETRENALLVSLEDGSRVWLNDHSSLTVKKMSSSKRKVSLKGEAYFEVSENKKAPFTISSDQLEVTVLGTSFVFNEKEAALEVFTGKVNVASKGEEKFVEKNQKISLKNQKLELGTGLGQIPGWANPILSFSNAPFDKVVKDLEAFFGVSIALVGEKDWAKCPFTSGSMATTKFEDVLIVLRLTYEMEVEKKGEKEYRFLKIRCK
ncbi:MAG: FecR family protein [Saprospiraceae bacterium]|nr:FecR family protein [Saprospiraceae bacterium]